MLPDHTTVRLLIADVSEDPAKQLLTEDQVQNLLDLEGGNVKRAAAAALDAIATSEVLVSKKIRTQDLQADGPAVAAELRAQAKNLRDRADADDEGTDDGFFDVVDTLPACRRPEHANHTTVWGL